MTSGRVVFHATARVNGCRGPFTSVCSHVDSFPLMSARTSVAPAADRLTRFAVLVGSLIPDAMSTSIVLLVLVAASALAMGSTAAETMGAYYRGLWMLLQFTMQMTLILVLSRSLGATPLFKRMVLRLAQVPRTTTGCSASDPALRRARLLLLGPGPRAGPHHRDALRAGGREAGGPGGLPVPACGRRRGPRGVAVRALRQRTAPDEHARPLSRVDHRGDAASYDDLHPGSGDIHPRVSGVAPGLEPLAHAPRAGTDLQLSRQLPAGRSAPGGRGGADDAPAGGPTSVTERIEGHSGPILVLCLALGGWIFYHFAIKGSGLDLNSLNTSLLLLCLLLHRNVKNFSAALQGAVVTAWPVIVLYHVYAGVGGLIQFTTVGKTFAEFFGSISNRSPSRSSPRSRPRSCRSSCRRAAASGPSRGSLPRGRRPRWA